jgi:hypothetical protein
MSTSTPLVVNFPDYFRKRGIDKLTDELLKTAWKRTDEVLGKLSLDHLAAAHGFVLKPIRKTPANESSKKKGTK